MSPRTETGNSFTVVSRSDYRDHPWSLHRAGCRDVTKDKHQHSGTLYAVPEEITTIDGAIDWWIDVELTEMGYDRSSFKVYDCCNDKEER